MSNNTNNVETVSEYAESVIRRVRYNVKNDGKQQAMMNNMVASQFKDVKIAAGVELTSGAVIYRLQEVIGAFGEEEKTEKNAAASIMRVQLQRGFATLTGTKGLKVGLKAKTATKKDRIVVTAKAEKKEPTLPEQVAALFEAYGTEAVVAEVEKQLKQYVKEAA